MDKFFIKKWRKFAFFLANGFRFWRRVVYLSKLRFYKVAIVLFFVGFLGVLAMEVPANSQEVPVLIRQGVDFYEKGDYLEAISVWKQALSGNSLPAKEAAVIYRNLGMAYRQVGQLSEAIKVWDLAADFYQKSENSDGILLAKIRIEQGQTYSDLGQYRRAIELLKTALDLASNDKFTRAAALGALGNAFSGAGDYDRAIERYQEGLKLARELNQKVYVSTLLNNVGNLYIKRAERYAIQANSARLEGDDKEEENLKKLAKNDRLSAADVFEVNLLESSAVGGFSEVRALLGYNNFLQKIEEPDPNILERNINKVLGILRSLPASRDKAFGLIEIGNQMSYGGKVFSLEALEILNEAIQVSRNIADRRAESFALGELGKLYETAKNDQKAMEFTRLAQLAAQEVRAAESLYLWQWQGARLLRKNGEFLAAKVGFEEAIATLESIRGDLVAANKELQFDFRDSVEPVYRQYIDLLLSSEINLPTNNQQNIRKALDVLDLLKLAELQNFFGDECVEVAQDTVKKDGRLVDKSAAIVYSVILPNQTYLILELADGRLKNFTVLVKEEEIKEEINALRSLLERRSTNEYLTQSQKVYELLIRPLEVDLIAVKPKTLVFVNDGVLRQVPMAALHDGERFFIEKYAISTTASLSLTASLPLERQNLEALMAGLTVAKPPFSALSNVEAEVNGVEKILGGKSILDKDFTLANLENALAEGVYPIVHLATHGKFGVDTESTFLLAYDTRISVEEIDRLLRVNLRQPVQLLTLSACQTAAGDNRSALGIAGVAVRAGVKSALASLWYINDASTVPLIEEFYRQLRQPEITKAEALRRAQLMLIKNEDYAHPAVWSPFIVIGNWL
ncbi:CHAT domain-containing protein [Ancylothrix sp. C2]|uniref:CHAT domain-containing protein n=1 Tax=Ancylothrix sp. D3o TaxID=2953691 RepID=UPI0021BB1E75|nr:CHAT domain-containing protein [Ancylothrix sp. D3o]MCT7948200.1 CHAT domain-containing protein [Ancylothrix sp. D3o]